MLWFRPGLSPLARGTPPLPDSDQAGARFIPAGAGNTAPGPVSGRGAPVYPRWRGEHDYLPGGQKRGCGSSPLARGTHFGNRTGSTGHRFIPAGAGNTQKIRCGAGTSNVFIPAGAGNISGYFFIDFIRLRRSLSPLAREHRIGIVDKTQPAGVSPAGAGNCSFSRGISVSG